MFSLRVLRSLKLQFVCQPAISSFKLGPMEDLDFTLADDGGSASKNKSKKQVMNKDSKKLVGKLATKMTSKKPAANAKRKKPVIKAAKTKKPMIKAETKKKETRQTTTKESKQQELAEELFKEIEQLAASEAEKEDGMPGNLKPRGIIRLGSDCAGIGSDFVSLRVSLGDEVKIVSRPLNRMWEIPPQM